MKNNNDLKTILHTFTCDKSDPRVFLREPFNYGKYTYFTDGNVMVRIPKEEGHQELPEEKKENYHNAINKFFASFKSASFKPLPAVPDITMQTCTDCGGSGKLTKKECPECEGFGEVEAQTEYNTYDVPCKTCDEVGYINVNGGDHECENCDGTGQSPKFKLESMNLDGGLISLKMAHRIKSLPSLEIGKIGDLFFGFKFEGGTGVAAGVQDPEFIAMGEVVNAKCNCGEPISIELNSPTSCRTDKKRLFYPDQKLPEGVDKTVYSERGSSVFRCRNCGESVGDSVPAAKYEDGDKQ
ncbi:TPA: hypothetical protein NKZ51_004545 [Vibrio parahaemolyticus]|nr:hypothetical protein [Vibrio parahaemolyticus]